MKLAVEIDEEVRSLIFTAKTRATTILEENRGRLSEIAEYLIVNESVEGENLEALFEGRKPVVAEVAEEAVKEAPAQPAPSLDPIPAPHMASQQSDRPITDGGAVGDRLALGFFQRHLTVVDAPPLHHLLHRRPLGLLALQEIPPARAPAAFHQYTPNSSPPALRKPDPFGGCIPCEF